MNDRLTVDAGIEDLKIYMQHMNLDLYQIFFMACEKGSVKIVKFLIEECDIDPNMIGGFRQASLILACESGKLDLVKLLVEKGVRVDIQMFGETPFHRACLCLKFKNNPHIVKYLAQIYVDRNIYIYHPAHSFEHKCLSWYRSQYCGWDENKHRYFPPQIKGIITTLLIISRSKNTHTKSRSQSLHNARLVPLYHLFRWISMLDFFEVTV
jgi:ankyrin repeat protein